MNKHIHKAIETAGSQTNLAKSLGVTQAFISLMLNEVKPVPARLYMKIERLTGGEVTAIDLLPEVFSA